MSAIRVNDPLMELGIDVKAKVGLVPAWVIPVKLMLPPSLGSSAVMVCPDVKFTPLNNTVSCGKGTWVDHVLVDQLPPEVPFHVWLLGAVKVKVPPPAMPLPPQLPIKLTPALVKSRLEPPLLKRIS